MLCGLGERDSRLEEMKQFELKLKGFTEANYISQPLFAAHILFDNKKG